MLFGALQMADVGTRQEQLGASSWSGWAVPLLGTEAVCKGVRFCAAELLRSGNVETWRAQQRLD